MLILKKPIELNSLKPFRTSWSLFGEKIAANYRFLLTDVKAEDLLHMAVTPPEGDTEEDNNNLLTVNFSPHYTNQLRSEMMNNWFNRILLIGTQDFTYQDEVYVTQLMQKMGITQTAEFINLVHQLYRSDKTAANLIKNYSAIGQEFRKVVQNINHVNVRKQEEQATQLTARYFLQEEIYRHLATAELTHTVYEYHKGVQGIYYELASEDILLAEHLKMADMIQIARLKSENVSGVCPPTLLYSDYYEQNTILQGGITEKKVLTQIVSAVLLHVTDMIHRSLQSIVITDRQQNPQLLRQCLPAVYHSLPAILVQVREQNRQKKWQRDGAYSSHSEQQLRDSSKQLYEYEVQLMTLFAEQYREAKMMPSQAMEQIACHILQTQNVEQQLAEYYNCVQAGGHTFDQEQLAGHKIYNNEIISNLQKEAYYLENSATMQMTLADNGENMQFSSNADSQMTFIRLQVKQIEKKQTTLFENNIIKYLLHEESVMAMPDKDTASELITVYEDAGLGFVTKSEENQQDADIVYEEKLAEITAEHEARHPRPVTAQESKAVGTASGNDGKPEGTTIQYVNRNEESVSEYAGKNAEPASVNEEKYSGTTIIYESKAVEILGGDEGKQAEYVAGDEKKQTDNVTGYESNHTEVVPENKRKITVSETENESDQILTAKEYKAKTTEFVTEYEDRFTEAVTEYVHKSVEDMTEYGGKSAGDMIEYGGKSAGAMAEYGGKSAGDMAEYGGKSAGDMAEYVHKSVKDMAEYGGKSVKDMAEYGGKSADDKTEYVHKVTEYMAECGGKSDGDMTEHSGKKVEYVTEYGRETIEPVTVQEERLTEPTAEYKWKQAELVTVLENKSAEPDTVYGGTVLEQVVVSEGISQEQGEFLEYAATLQPTSDQRDRKEQSILYEEVIQKQLNLYQTNTLVNRPPDDTATLESMESINSEKIDSEEHKKEIQIQQDIQMKQFLDSVNEQNIQMQQALQNQRTVNETVLQVRIDREAAKKNTIEMLENPQEVLSKMMEHSDIVNRKKIEQILSDQVIQTETAKAQFPEQSQELELQAAIQKVNLHNEPVKFHDIEYRSYPEPNMIVSREDELQLIYKQSYRETEEERAMHLQQKKIITEEQVKIIEKDLENYVNGNISQKLTHTAMTELKEEIKITRERVIPNLIQQNMQIQMTSISERVYRKLERRLMEERQRRGY